MHALVDTHCHLDVPEFDGDRDAVVARARDVGVTRQIVPAIEANTWPALRDACAHDAGLFPAYGLHPMMIASHRAQHLRALRDWIERERPCAIGECGLDFFVEGTLVEVDSVEELVIQDGEVIDGRVLNGDERLTVLPTHRVGAARIRLLRVQ
jgi:TatD DNase family protein